MSLTTTKPDRPQANETVPTRAQAWLFRAKVAAHRAKRLLVDWQSGPTRLGKAATDGFSALAGQSRTALWPEALAQERSLQLGKVQNLRRAAAALDGVLIRRGETFSFWRQVGRASRARGYVAGRMLQQGCMVPAVGGGLCQLSNALYDVALQAGCTIVERHAHSRVVPGSQAAIGRDATVAWNYVDLRFKAPRDLRLQVRLDRHGLNVRLLAREAVTPLIDRSIFVPLDHAAQSCDTCNEVDCFRHIALDATLGIAPAERTAFIVDGATPEFAAYVARQRRQGDVLALPMRGRRYAWPSDGFATVLSAPLATLRRSLESRRLADQGAARQRALLQHAERLALALARQLPPEVTELVIAQSLLPFLWRNGDLGGRRVTVLMNRLPMDLLQARLDVAAAQHPDSPTLRDFRAPVDLVEAEREALAYAERIVTPHAEIAASFDKAQLLPWHVPPATTTSPIHRVAFVGPTLGRKGAYEMLEAARALKLDLLVPRRDLEGPDFWSGITVKRGAPLEAQIVVQPAFAEENPRTLLTALANGRQVIATSACGLPPQPGLVLVPYGDTAALIDALRAALARPAS